MTNLQAVCPNCGHDNDYVFPYGIPKGESELTCGKCQQKMPLLNKAKEQLNPRSPMPFGRYRGWELRQVPAKYLVFLWENVYKGKLSPEPSPIEQYIHDNLEDLKKSQFAPRLNLRY